jgi:hypothetical protein
LKTGQTSHGQVGTVATAPDDELVDVGDQGLWGDNEGEATLLRESLWRQDGFRDRLGLRDGLDDSLAAQKPGLVRHGDTGSEAYRDPPPFDGCACRTRPRPTDTTHLRLVYPAT